MHEAYSSGKNTEPENLTTQVHIMITDFKKRTFFMAKILR